MMKSGAEIRADIEKNPEKDGFLLELQLLDEIRQLLEKIELNTRRV